MQLCGAVRCGGSGVTWLLLSCCCFPSAQGHPCVTASSAQPRLEHPWGLPLPQGHPWGSPCPEDAPGGSPAPGTPLGIPSPQGHPCGLPCHPRPGPSSTHGPSSPGQGHQWVPGCPLPHSSGTAAAACVGTACAGAGAGAVVSSEGSLRAAAGERGCVRVTGPCPPSPGR